MDYFKQRRAYRDLKMYETKISEGQNNLYRELLDYANDKRRLEMSFKLTNDALLKLTGSSLSGLVKSRKKLVELKLIEYKKGKRNTDAPSYRIVQLYSVFDKKDNSQDRDSTTVGTIDRTTVRDANSTTVGTTNLSTSTITNTITNTQRVTPKKLESDDDDFKNLITYYQENISQTSPVVIQQLRESVNDFTEHKTSLKESYDIVRFAIELTASNNVHSWKYVNTILNNWQKNNLFTLSNIKSNQNNRSNNDNQSNEIDWDKKYKDSAKTSGLPF